MTFDDLVTRLVSLYDVTTTRAAEVANERLQRMLAEAKSLRAIKTIGTTVANQSSYALDATVVQVYKVKIPYTTGTINYEGTESLEDLWDVDSGISEPTNPDTAYWFAIEADSDSLADDGQHPDLPGARHVRRDDHGPRRAPAGDDHVRRPRRSSRSR
jgi:hypothetical protein